MEYCEGVYHDNSACKYSQQQIYNYLLRKQIHASIFKKEIYRFLIFIEFCLRYLVFQIVFSEETWIKRCTRIGTRSLNNLKVIKF